MSDLQLPQGVKALTSAQQLVVHVVEQKDEEEAPAAEAGEGSAEPEVIGKGKKDEEGAS